MKTCPKCHRAKPPSEFYVNVARRDGLSPRCVDCSRAANVETNAKLRQRILDHFGGRCQTCGFDDPRALQVDHVNGGGSIERRVTSPLRMAGKILADDGSTYQLLCANCHAIKTSDAKRVNRRTRKIPTEQLERPNLRWTPEQRAAQAERWADPEFRERSGLAGSGERMRQLWEDPEFRERQSREQSERMKRRWASGEIPDRKPASSA